MVIVGNENQRLTKASRQALCWIPEDQEDTKSVKMYNSLPVGIKQCDGLLYCV